MTIAKDPKDTRAVQATTIRRWIKDMLNEPDPKSLADEYIQAESKAAPHQPKPDEFVFDEPAQRKFAIICRRVYTDCELSAMALACDLHRFDTGHWPASVDDLRAALPSVPVDLWGDGKQMLGYALIKTGLPDGSDRPLVYSREDAGGKIFFRTDRPFYGYYNGDGSNRLGSQQLFGGQFRDVAAWAPTTPVKANATPTTQRVD